MEAKNSSVDAVQAAIQQLVDSRKSKLAASGGSGGKSESDISLDGDYEILSELLSQLQALEGEAGIKQSLAREDVPLCAVNEVEKTEVEHQRKVIGTEEIIEELKNVKRQNTITHGLLSGLIFITVVWQLSEISLILKMKNGLTHPFRSFGSMLSGMIKRPSRNGQDGEKQTLLAPVENLVEAPSLPVQIPLADLSGLAIGDDE